MEEGVDTLGRWMAHHLAELLTEAEHAKGSRRKEAKERVVDLILKIWDRRRLLQGQIDPLATYQKGAEVLSAIHASADAFSQWAPPRAPTQVSLSLEIYVLASRLALVGMVETLPKNPGAIPPAVESMLAPAEREFLGAARTLDRLARGEVGKPKTRVASPASATDAAAVRTTLLKKIQASAAIMLALPVHVADASLTPAKKRRSMPAKSTHRAAAKRPTR